MSGHGGCLPIYYECNAEEVNGVQSWIEGFQRSIDHIEQNLSGMLDIEDIAAEAALSPFYYQRIFGAMCGMTGNLYESYWE